MDLLGLTGVQAAIVITIIGLVLTNVVGWLKNGNTFNVRNAAATGILALVVTLPTMALTISALPNDLDELAQFAFVITYIGTVAGFDTLGKGMIRAGQKGRTTPAK